MFYKNSLISPKNIKYETVIYDFIENSDCDNLIEKSNREKSILNINFDNSNNVLKSSYGEQDFVCTNSQDGNGEVFPKVGTLSGLKNVKYFVKTDSTSNTAKKKIIVETNNSIVYYSNLNDGMATLYELIKLDENCTSKFFDYYYDLENLLLISTFLDDVGKFYIYDGSAIVQSFENAPHIFDICAHNNTLFLSIEDGLRNKIYYIDDLNPANIVSNYKNMKSIGLPINKGKIMKLLSFDDYLYVICEYGIIKIISYKNQEDLYIEEVYSGTARIIEDTIVKGGDNIIFADTNAIYLFNGTNVEKQELGINNLFEGVNKWRSCACFNEGKYYLSTKLNYTDETIETYDESKNNSLIVFNIDSRKVEVCCGISICKIATYQDESQSRVAILSGPLMSYKLKTLCKSGIYNGDNIAKKIFKTQYKDLNKPNNLKIIRSINIKTHEDIILNLICDDETYQYNLSGSEKNQNMIINKKTIKFAVEIISTTANPFIKDLSLRVGIYE